MIASRDVKSLHGFFETLFNHAKENTVLIMDGNGIISAINKAFTLCFGYSEKDILGKHLSILFTEEDQKKGLPQQELDTVLREGRSADNNYLVHHNGTITWVSGESLLVKNATDAPVILKVIQDIHTQKETERALRAANDFSEDILRSIDDAVIVLNTKLNVVKANHSFQKLVGKDERELSSFAFADFIKPHDVNDNLLNSIQTAIRTKKGFSNKSTEIEIASGAKKIFEVSCTPMQNADGYHFLLVIHDVTIYKLVEREREDIIGFVAHELRNPLANLVLSNEIMDVAIDDNNKEQLKDMLQRSKNNITRLNKMIAELYDATRLNSGHMELEIAPFNFKDMITEAIDTVKVLQPAYNIIVKGDANMEVWGDRYRLIQVITNYLSNGIKYSNGKTDVTLTVQHSEDAVTVSVKDEGLGIPPEQMPHIFGRFFRAEKSRSIEGIGLGLYLCRQIIHAHKGQVWAESEEGKGSTFYFSIPRNL
jgi:PAS domain S-box-containing protein